MAAVTQHLPALSPPFLFPAVLSLHAPGEPKLRDIRIAKLFIPLIPANYANLKLMANLSIVHLVPATFL